MFKSLHTNSRGKDFVVGDIHGCFTLLEQELDRIGFNKNTDRLLSVGDLIDRGPESAAVLDYLSQPWFHAVRGNHEQMCIDGATSRDQRQMHAYNGGEFFYDLTPPQQQAIRAAFNKLPIAIEVYDRIANGLPNVIIHAECANNSWATTKTSLKRNDNNTYQRLIWGRSKITARDTTPVSGARNIYVGHTPVTTYMTLGNVHYIDTGACRNGNLTILEI